jgi:hypothetical protein
MAFESIFSTLRPKRVTLQVMDGTAARTLLSIDCTPVEDFGFEAQATLHDIEEGAQVSDHIIKKGRTLSIEGIISDAPINLTGTLAGNAAGLIGGALGGTAGALATAGTVVMANLALAGSAKPSKAALDIFDEIYQSGAVLTIIGGLTTHTNMVMEQFKAIRTARTGGGLAFKASFRQITIVAGKSVEVPKAALASDVKDLSATEKQQGRKQGEALEGNKQSKAASWAYRIGQGLGLVGGN